MHLSLVKLVLEVERLLDELKLDKSGHDLADGKLLGSHDGDHLSGPLLGLHHARLKDVLV